MAQGLSLLKLLGRGVFFSLYSFSNLTLSIEILCSIAANPLCPFSWYSSPSPYEPAECFGVLVCQNDFALLGS